MPFLPEGYDKPEVPSNYMKLDKPENTFRVLGDAIVGYEWWEDVAGKRTPQRVKSVDDVPETRLNTTNWKEKAKHFWAFPVLNREANAIQILEITQQSIMDQLEGLVESKSWGNPQDYDIVVAVKKTGPDPKDVEYSVRPEPKEELDEGIKALYTSMNVDLEKLFQGKDPFEKTQ